MAATKNPSEKSIGEKSRFLIGENSPSGIGEKPLAKIPTPTEATTSDFSPIEYSPIKKREFSPTKKAKLKLVNPAKNGKRGRPRNPELPPSPGKYIYWTEAGGGLKLERRRPSYEYLGFIMPQEWQHLRGQYGEDYILKIIISTIRVKRARSAKAAGLGSSATG